jgi:hypothetical protein
VEAAESAAPPIAPTGAEARKESHPTPDWLDSLVKE